MGSGRRKKKAVVENEKAVENTISAPGRSGVQSSGRRGERGGTCDVLDRSADEVLRGSTLDETVVAVRGVLSREECQAVARCHISSEPMGEEHDRQATLSFVHEVWRIEDELKTLHTQIYDRIIRNLMQSVDSHYWEMLQYAHDENSQLRLLGECKRGKDRVLIRPEVEYIVYDADEAARKETPLPHIGPHTDNSSVVTLVCLLSHPSTFKGGVNYFCPAVSGQPPREYMLQQGDAVLFRGEKCLHWISDVTEGIRSILQIELALCAGMHDAPLSGDQARARNCNSRNGNKRIGRIKK